MKQKKKKERLFFFLFVFFYLFSFLHPKKPVSFLLTPNLSCGYTLSRHREMEWVLCKRNFWSINCHQNNLTTYLHLFTNVVPNLNSRETKGTWTQISVTSFQRWYQYLQENSKEDWVWSVWEICFKYINDKPYADTQEPARLHVSVLWPVICAEINFTKSHA